MAAMLLFGLIGLGAGCGDMGSLAYFLMPDQRLPAKMKHLPSEDPKREPRVVILTYAGLDTRAEFLHADRQLGELLARGGRYARLFTLQAAGYVS